MKKTSVSQAQVFRMVVLTIVFLSLTCLLYLGFREDKVLTSSNQKLFYSLGMGALLSGLVTLLLSAQLDDTPKPKKRWFYPLMSGLLGFCCMSLAYIYLGVWPIGDRSVMIVDMHHQYAPLLAQLRDMLLHGGSPLYSFEVGLGGSFLPVFGYYLSSPFNLLLMFFPESMLTEGILVITLLKNALTACFFAVCVQYIYRRRDISVVIVSIMYSMMMYLLAYSWNIMWLDCVMVLPLVVMSFEKLMRTGKYLPYVLSLAYALYANYYIAFMLCIFLVLYFICYSTRQVRTPESRRRSLGRFVIGSLLGGGLVMFLIIPVYISLGQTSAAGSEFPEMKNLFDMFDLLGRHLYETSPTIRSKDLPNIYCGMLSVFMLPIFASMKSIPLRRRISYMMLLVVMAASLVLNQFNLLWHGLHSPNDLPYRFSFLYSFVLLLITYETLVRIKQINFRQVCSSSVILLAYLIIEERFGSDDYSFDTIYISLLLVLIYAVVIGLVSRRRVLVRPAYCLLLLVVTAEMTFNAGASFKKLNSNEHFTAHKDYVANDVTKTLHKVVNRTEEIGNAASNGSFYRMEFFPHRTIVDTALYDYRGITVFASSNPEKLTKFMGYLGYANNGVNSYLYKNYVPQRDSLLGIKYMFTNKNMSSQPTLSQVEKVKSGCDSYTIYENKAALPLGFLVNSSIKDWTATKYNPIFTQNSLYASMTGNSDSLYEYAELSAASVSSNVASVSERTSFSINPTDNQKSATFNANISKPGHVYVYVDCGAAESIDVSSEKSWSVNPREPYIIDAGIKTAGTNVSVSVTAKSSCVGNIYVCTLNEDVLNKNLEKLASNPLKVTSFTDTHISGQIEPTKSGTVFTSVTYDKGWTVKVDGKKVQTFALGNAMLAFDVGEGKHTVEMSFSTVGLIPGIIISVLSLALLIVLLYFIQKKVDHDDPYDDEFTALDRLLKQKPVANTLPMTEASVLDTSWQDTKQEGEKEARGIDNDTDAGL